MVAVSDPESPAPPPQQQPETTDVPEQPADDPAGG
jgi:hypothetical protein